MSSQSAGQFKLPPPKFRKKLSIPLKPKPIQNLLGGGITLSPAARVISPEPTPRQFTPDNLPEGIELLDSELYIGFQCMYCDAKLTSEAILKRHIDGTEHQKKLLLKKVSGKKGSQPEQTAKLAVDKSIKEISPSVVDKEEPEKSVITPPKSTLAEHLIDTSQPIVGLDFVVETLFPDTQPTFHCKMCGVTCNTEEIKEHIVGIRHCLMYLQMVESKKIDEIRSQFRKKTERNQEILKFAAQVEKERGRGTVKLILQETLNKEPSKKTDSQDGKEKKDTHSSVKRSIEEESPSSSRKKTLISNEVLDSKSNENAKYHSSNDPNMKQHSEDQEKELVRPKKKHTRFSSPSDVENTATSIEESHSLSAVKTMCKTSLPKPQPKKPLYKPPRSFLLPSDIIKAEVARSQSVFTQVAPPPQITPQPTISVKSTKTAKTLVTEQSRKSITSSGNGKSAALQSRKQVDSKKTRWGSPPRHDASQSKSRLTPIQNEQKSLGSYQQSQSNLSRNEKHSSLRRQQLDPSAVIATPHPHNPARSISEHYIKYTQPKLGNAPDIAALRNLCSFIISNADDAENVMEVIRSLTYEYLQYKTRVLTNPVKELLIQSLKDGSEGLQIILRRHGVNNIEPLDTSGDINNDTTRCASNVLRQFSSNWKEETDDASDKSNDSLEQDSDALIPNSGDPATQTEKKLASILNSSPNYDSAVANTSEFQQHSSHNWKEEQNLPNLIESSQDFNGFPLRSDKAKMFDR